MSSTHPCFGRCLLACTVSVAWLWTAGGSVRADYRSPFDLAFSPGGKQLAVSDRTAGVLEIVDVAAATVAREVNLNGQPTGVVWSAGGRVFVAERGAGTVAEVDTVQGRVVRRLPVGLRPVGLALAVKRKLLVVANSHTDTVSVIDLAGGKERGRIRVPRQPYFVTVTSDESLALVGNLLPAGSAMDPETSAAVSVIDLQSLTDVADIRLPPGSTAVRELATSPDGRWAYVLHTVGRFNVPTTQIERGWINTNALTLIDLSKKQQFATLLLDNLAEGAANPWGLALSADGTKLWATIAGTHQLATVDLKGLHALLNGDLGDRKWLAKSGPYTPGTQSIWQEIKDDPKRRALLVNDLTALYSAKLITRMPIPGKGPRGLDVSPDGKMLAAAVYFSGTVALIDARNGKVTTTVSLGPSDAPDLARRGEIVFYDATNCFQHWLSCITCHPGSRVDGLNWDLLNDGLGNPKNVKSLVWAHKTPPMMARGVRENMDVAVLAGFRHSMFREPEPGVVEAARAYIRSLKPEPSPYLAPGGGLTDKAKRGRALFEGDTAKCAHCHPSPLLTDLETHNVGTRGPLDHADEFDTPTLVELWRTGPYLHDGSAVTVRDVLTTKNTHDLHGGTSHLSKEQLDALVAYLMSL